MRGAPVIEDFLHTTLATWLASREAIIQSWIDKGLIIPMQPRYLIYLIWAATQHYADFDHQITALNGSTPLDDAAFTTAKTQLITTLLRGVLTRYD
jgi:TetR/AcrR family transcriptional regulator